MCSDFRVFTKRMLVLCGAQTDAISNAPVDIDEPHALTVLMLPIDDTE